MIRIFFALLMIAAGVRAFEFSKVIEQIPESNPVTRIRVTEGASHFSFIAPPGWKLAPDEPGKRVTFQPLSGPGFLAVHLSTNTVKTAAGLNAIISGNFSDAAGIEQFQASSGGGSGFGADFRHRVGAQFLRTRLAVFPTPKGSVEIALTASNDQFTDLHILWTAFINSFRVEQTQAQTEKK